MSTESQIKANRKNAKKSTGPKTPEGKAKSAQNATTHGLTASSDVIQGESQEEFDAHYHGIVEDFAPRNTIEAFLADRVATLAWRLKRAGRMQNQVLNGLLLDHPYILENRGCLYEEPSNHDPDVRLGAVINRDFRFKEILERLTLYESRIQNSFTKSLNALERQKRQRKQPVKPGIGVENQRALSKSANSATDYSQTPAAHPPIDASTHPVVEIMQNKAKSPEPRSIAKPVEISTCGQQAGFVAGEDKANDACRVDAAVGVPVQKAVPMRPLTP